MLAFSPYTAPANCPSDSRNNEVSCSDNISNNGSSNDNDGAVVALAVLFSLAVIGLVISIGINILLVKKPKKSRYVVTTACAFDIAIASYMPVYS